ncbi:MAG: hypothetical protein P8Y97_23190 [Candidatus Lokiarchaeota archaeon]
MKKILEDDSIKEKIIKDLKNNGIQCSQIGYVNDSKKVSMIYEDSEQQNILPRFRESAYTKIKQEIGENNPKELKSMENAVEKAAQQALDKRRKIIKYINTIKS